jgi:RNA polymerase sigma-70 factor (sigma-E family)
MREPDGLREFVAVRSPSLLRFGWTLTGSWDSAEDLVQTALLKSIGHWRRITAEDPTGYVRRVMVNTYISSLRRRQVRELFSSQFPDANLADSWPDVDTRLTLSKILRRLPPRQRAIVALRYYEDLSEADVAEVMGCSVGTVKSQHAKAIAKLRDDAELQELIDKERAR